MINRLQAYLLCLEFHIIVKITILVLKIINKLLTEQIKDKNLTTNQWQSINNTNTMVSPNPLLCFFPSPKVSFLLLLVLTPFVLSCGSLGKLDLCKEVKPGPLQLSGVLESGLKPVDTALNHPLYFLWNIVIKSLCFGKLGNLEKSELIHSELKKEDNNMVILGAKGYPILVKEENQKVDPILINNQE